MIRVLGRVFLSLALALFAWGVYRFVPLPDSVRAILDVQRDVREADKSGRGGTKQSRDIVLQAPQGPADPKVVDEEAEAYASGRLPYYHSDEAVAPPPAPAAIPSK